MFGNYNGYRRPGRWPGRQKPYRLKGEWWALVCFVNLALITLAPSHSFALEFAGAVAFEQRGFFEPGLDGQDQYNPSFIIEPELIHTWSNGRQTLTFKPYFRLDFNDRERTHFDVRQLDWTTALGDFELGVGVRKVYWGVTESVHLVDFINQTDQVENLDGEQKLGQPMINLSWIQPIGTFSLFVMPFFRERTFPGESGRLRFQVPVQRSEAYESSAGQFHPDVALRWNTFIKYWDIGLYHFYGTNREPRLTQTLDSNGNPVLIPNYDLVHQTGLDIQMTVESWLFKFEMIGRDWQPRYYVSLVGGFEYTFYTIFGGNADFGLLAEMIYDERGAGATTPFEEDLFAGFRLALNDEDDSQLLVGGNKDLDQSSLFFNVEASRRVGNHWLVTLESRFFIDIAPNDFFYGFRKDSYLSLEVEYYF